MRVVIALLVWVGAVAGAAGVSSVVAHGVHSTGAGSVSFDASSVTATESHSLFRTANLERALNIVRSHLGAATRIDRLVLYPGYLDLTAVRPGGEVDVYVNAAGRYEPTTTSASPGDSPLFSLARVRADVPAALAQRIATAGHVPKSQLRYMIAELDSSDHRFHWLIYTQPGSGAEYFQISGPTGPLFEYRTGSPTGLQRIRG